MRNLSLLAPIFMGITLAASATAQLNKPQPSPAAKLTQTVGLVQLDVEYSRPGVKGRTIFGELLPYGKIWRTGANACTKITFGDNAKVGGQEVPKGTYSVFTYPGKETWTFVLNKNIELWGEGGYDPAQDVMRVDVPVRTLKESRETMTIDFANFHSNGADLTITWATSQISVPIFVDSDSLVFAEIDQKILKAENKDEITGRTYFDAAMFYVEKDKDLKQAAEWLDIAVAKSPAAFWQIYAQGELALKMGDAEKAKSCMEASMKAAEASPNGDYGYIEKCKALLKKIASN